MKTPVSLIVISIIIIIIGVLRLLSGVVGYAVANLDSYYLVFLLVDNVLCGTLIIVSGVLMLLEKSIGRLIYITVVVGLFIFYLIMMGPMVAIISCILPAILLVIMLIITNVTKCFEIEKIR